MCIGFNQREDISCLKSFRFFKKKKKSAKPKRKN